MPQKQEIDFSKIYEVLQKIEKRITLLEKDSGFIEKRINSITKDGKDKYLFMHSDTAKIKEKLNNIKKELRNCVLAMINLSEGLKVSIKKDQLDQLSEQIDTIKHEQYLTKRDLKRDLKTI